MGQRIQGVVIGLDLGMSCGWAVRDTDDGIRSGTISLHRKTRDPWGHPFARLYEHLDELHDAHIGEEIAVAVERVPSGVHRGKAAAQAYGGFLGTVAGWCAAHGIVLYGMAPSTLKKRAAGNGRSQKTTVQKVLSAQGYLTSTLDEADAVAVALHVLPSDRIDPLPRGVRKGASTAPKVGHRHRA